MVHHSHHVNTHPYNMGNKLMFYQYYRVFLKEWWGVRYVYISYFFSCTIITCVNRSLTVKVSMCASFVTQHTSMWWSNSCHTCCSISGMMVSTARLILFRRSEVLERLGQWGYITHVLHVPPQEEITWSYIWELEWPLEKGASLLAAHPIHHCRRIRLSKPAMETWSSIVLLEHNQLCCGDHHTWNAAAGVARIWPSHWCVLGNGKCIHRGTLMDAHKI
jgi:hypothetical protein